MSSLLAPVDKAAATPWPNEAAMRQGLLFQLEGSMSGVGDVGVVGDGEYMTQDSSAPLPQFSLELTLSRDCSGASATRTTGRARGAGTAIRPRRRVPARPQQRRLGRRLDIDQCSCLASWSRPMIFGHTCTLEPCCMHAVGQCLPRKPMMGYKRKVIQSTGSTSC